MNNSILLFIGGFIFLYELHTQAKTTRELNKKLDQILKSLPDLTPTSTE
jgi:predicted transcriptional regulator